MSGSLVEVAGVHKRFGEHVALHRIDLAIGAREFVSLLGPSGCGKTTLLRIMAGFERADGGKVFIHGNDVTGMPPHKRPTNIVFQRGALFPHMNVAENVGYSLKIQKRSKAQIASRVEQMLALVRLEGLGGRGPTELSGGQIQRAALARALAPEPEVLLLDEPLSALDLKLRQHMQLELRAIQRELGAIFVYVTHDQTEAMVMSDRIAVMNQGRIVQEGTAREIYMRPASVFASDFIGDTNLIVGSVAAVDEGAVMLEGPGGATLEGEAPAELRPGTRATLSVRPESLRLAQLPAAVLGAAERGAADRVLQGTISDIIYLGNRVRVEIEVPDDVMLLADLRDEDSAGLERGDRVTVRWARSAATVWAGDEGAAMEQPEAGGRRA